MANTETPWHIKRRPPAIWNISLKIKTDSKVDLVYFNQKLKLDLPIPYLYFMLTYCMHIQIKFHVYFQLQAARYQIKRLISIPS